MRKDFLRLLTLGLLGGFIGAYLFINFVATYPANISQATTSVPAISSAPRQGFWEKIISETSLASVGIQVFQADHLVRQGSGMVISSDGLIITVADLSALNGTYQIFYEEKIFKGTVVARDYGMNLMLIKTENSYSNIADLSSGDYKNGQEVVLVGRSIDLSKPVLFSQRGLLSYVTEKKINIDSFANKNLYGAGVVDENNSFIGLAYLRGGVVNLVRSSSIEKFFNEHTSK